MLFRAGLEFRDGVDAQIGAEQRRGEINDDFVDEARVEQRAGQRRAAFGVNLVDAAPGEGGERNPASDIRQRDDLRTGLDECAPPGAAAGCCGKDISRLPGDTANDRSFGAVATGRPNTAGRPVAARQPVSSIRASSQARCEWQKP